MIQASQAGTPTTTAGLACSCTATTARRGALTAMVAPSSSRRVAVAFRVALTAPVVAEALGNSEPLTALRPRLALTLSGVGAVLFPGF